MKSKKISEELIQDLYNENFEFTLQDGKKLDIPLEGNLGLLSIGYEGLVAWRKKREEAGYVNPNEIIMQENKKENKKENKN